MLSAIFIICLVLCIISCRKWHEGLALLFGSVALLLAIALCFVGSDFLKGFTLTDKIEMYEAENAGIEQTIDSFVENYCDYENQTYKNLTPENASLFAISYPELASNQVVKTQLEVYIDNNNIIKDLRAQQIDQSVYRFLIYFGW